MTTNINSSSSSQMKHIAFSKPRVDDDSRVEALDALTMMLFEEENKEEEMMMMSEALTSEVLDASNSTLIRAKCFALLQRMNERRANKSENNEKKKKNSIIIIYEQMCVHPIREWMRILLDDDESTTSIPVKNNC